MEVNRNKNNFASPSGETVTISDKPGKYKAGDGMYKRLESLHAKVDSIKSDATSVSGHMFFLSDIR